MIYKWKKMGTNQKKMRETMKHFRFLAFRLTSERDVLQDRQQCQSGCSKGVLDICRGH